jgi:hypothetical protein
LSVKTGFGYESIDSHLTLFKAINYWRLKYGRRQASFLMAIELLFQGF